MSLWSYITGTTPQEEQQAGLDYEQTKFNEALARREAAGTISAEQDTRERQYAGVTLEDVDAGARAGFVEGAKEGLNNVLDFPGKVVGAAGQGANQVLLGILKNIPWWVYLLAAGGVFFYFGGFALLARRFIKR